MDWITAIQKALNYMEEHMLENIDYEEIASSVYISSFHFHSAFSLIMGMTANEYIRKRRLSMAGQELARTKAKVIDIALKYGYDSPESFAKAFLRFHGVSPSQARRPGTTLLLFNPMKIKITVEGGKIMDYRIENRKTFHVLVKAKAFRNETINEEGNRDIPDFWTQCRQDGTFDILGQYRVNDDNYAVCSPLSSQKSCFDYAVGVLCRKDISVPDGFRLWTVDEGLWAVFPCIGTDESCMDGVWEKIYREFLPQSGYEIRNYADFEYYPASQDGIFCEIWVPIREKK